MTRIDEDDSDALAVCQPAAGLSDDPAPHDHNLARVLPVDARQQDTAPAVGRLQVVLPDLERQRPSDFAHWAQDRMAVAFGNRLVADRARPRFKQRRDQSGNAARCKKLMKS